MDKRHQSSRSQQPSKKVKTEAAETMTIIGYATLPDVVLLIIFGYLPLEILLLHIPLICTNWRRLQVEAIQSRTHISLLANDPEHKIGKRIQYIMGPDAIYFASPDDFEQRLHRFRTKPDFAGTVFTQLCNPKFSGKAIRQLVSNFPKLDTLEMAVNIGHPLLLNMITVLFNHWAPTLITVKLWTFWDDCLNTESPERNREAFHEFIAVINSMPKLENFTFYANRNMLCLPDPFPFKNELPRIDAQFLARLKVFSFNTEDPAHIILRALKQVCKRLPSKSVLYQFLTGYICFFPKQYAEQNPELQSIKLNNVLWHEVEESDQLSDNLMGKFLRF